VLRLEKNYKKNNATALAAAKDTQLPLEFFTEREVFLQLRPAVSVLGTEGGNAMPLTPTLGRQCFFVPTRAHGVSALCRASVSDATATHTAWPFPLA
jgi:hypothetical protein